ncbi:hypothetical protein [Fusobacterium sp.]|uniref:hypothetical protein n=1 Tax=Fusobacterium sp. TaxID=68766 RepID=UPI0025C4ECAE|nr:hypothetical protein [Fusobacterium sp.]
MTGNVKKLADKIRKNPDILTDYTAHSQGTITSANAIIDIINSGDGDILKGKKIRFNGSPLQLDKMEKLSKKKNGQTQYAALKSIFDLCEIMLPVVE